MRRCQSQAKVGGIFKFNVPGRNPAPRTFHSDPDRMRRKGFAEEILNGVGYRGRQSSPREIAVLGVGKQHRMQLAYPLVYRSQLPSGDDPCSWFSTLGPRISTIRGFLHTFMFDFGKFRGFPKNRRTQQVWGGKCGEGSGNDSVSGRKPSPSRC